MSTYNIYFCGEINKIIRFWLKKNTLSGAILVLSVFSTFQTFYKQCVHDKEGRSAPSTTSTTSAPNTTNVSTTTTPAQNHSVHLSLRSTVEDRCEEPVSYVPDHVLPELWHVVYWTSQFLTW